MSPKAAGMDLPEFAADLPTAQAAALLLKQQLAVLTANEAGIAADGDSECLHRFRVAVRRTTRIGERSGVPVEGLGVTPDELHHMTANDLLNKNEDLINRAAQLLAEMRAQTLDVKFLARENGTVKLTVTTKNIERLDMWVGGRPQSSLDVGDGKTMLAVALGKRAKRIEVRGFANEELVAVKKFTVGAEEIG